MGKVDFSAFEGIGAFSMPQLMPFAPEFHPGAIIAVALLYLVSAAETLGDTAALAAIGFKRIPTEREFSGAVAADSLQLHCWLLRLLSVHHVCSKHWPCGYD